MKHWFDSLDSRERLFVLAGGAAIVLALLYAFLWTPLDQGHRALQASVTAWERSLAELRPLRGMTPALSTTGSQNPNLSVPARSLTRLISAWIPRDYPTSGRPIRCPELLTTTASRRVRLVFRRISRLILVSSTRKTGCPVIRSSTSSRSTNTSSSGNRKGMTALPCASNSCRRCSSSSLNLSRPPACRFFPSKK